MCDCVFIALGHVSTASANETHPCDFFLIGWGRGYITWKIENWTLTSTQWGTSFAIWLGCSLLEHHRVHAMANHCYTELRSNQNDYILAGLNYTEMRIIYSMDTEHDIVYNSERICPVVNYELQRLKVCDL